MDKKTLVKLSIETFAQMDKYAPLMINKAAEKLGIEIDPEEQWKLEELISKAFCSFPDLFVDYYIYTDDED